MKRTKNMIWMAVLAVGMAMTCVTMTSCAKEDNPVNDVLTKCQTLCDMMPNHVHLLIAEKSLKVGEVVKSIASCYVPYYNKKYGRIGHLLQDAVVYKMWKDL